MEAKMKEILQIISDPKLQVTYYPLTGMSKEIKNQLITDHFLFKDGDRFLQAANANHFWPIGRGIFHNKNKIFWCGSTKRTTLELSADKKEGLKAIQSKVQFSHDDRLGWLTFCPTNLGSTIRASAYLNIPNVLARPDFKKLCEDVKLQPRGIHGEHSEIGGGVVDVSNKARLGISEYTVVKMMYDGVKKLIELEKEAVEATRTATAGDTSIQTPVQKGANI